MVDTAVVILNFNGREYLQKFLPLVCQRTEEARIIVADNASTDQSIELLESDFPEVEILRIPSNLGYSGGYNYALSRIDATYYILLNSDIEVTSGWLSPLISALKSNPDLAACQPKILDYNNKDQFEYAGAAGGLIDWLGYPFCRGRIFEELELENGQYDDTRDIFWASGACLVIRASVFRKLDGFDNDFFAHMEEIDLCWRLQRTGQKIGYVPDSKVYHVGGGTLKKSNPGKTYLNFRNGLAMVYKNGDLPGVFMILFLRMILDGAAAFRLLFTHSGSHFIAVLKAHIYIYTHFGKLRKKRRSLKTRLRNSEISTIYRKSLVWQYFVRGIKKYTDLPGIN